MDLRNQLKNLFPDHVESEVEKKEPSNVWLQDDPIICKYEKRKGKPITILEGYNGAQKDFKLLAKEIKTKLSVGGSCRVGWRANKKKNSPRIPGRRVKKKRQN